MDDRSTGSMGVWRQTLVVVDGKRLSIGAGALMTIDEKGYTVTVGGKTFQKGLTSRNTTVTPYQSEVTVTEGMDVGQRYCQIFQVQGDILLACRGRDGSRFPDSFTSPAGSGQILSTWLRVPESEATAPSLAPQNFWVWSIFLFALGMSDAVRKDLQDGLGYWPGLAVTATISTALVMGAGLALKWDWKKGLILGTAMSVAFHTYEGLTPVLTPTLGGLGAILVATCTAMVLGMVIHQTASRLLKIQWN